MDRREFLKSSAAFVAGGITGAIGFSVFSEPGIKKRIFVKQHCVLCGGCSAVCPVQCIDFVFPGIRIDESLCIYCGECEVICPVRAIEIKK